MLGDACKITPLPETGLTGTGEREAGRLEAVLAAAIASGYGIVSFKGGAMRKMIGGSLAALVLVAVASTARAQLQAYDPFDYAAGAGGLTNKNGGTGWS